MNRATPRLKKFAERLLGYETRAGRAAAASETATSRVCEKLRRVLSVFLGTAGFWALLARAVALAKEEAPELGLVQVQPDGALDGLADLADDGQIVKSEVILIAHLLGLLVTFVGDALMLRLVQDAWPKANLDDLNSR